MPKEKIIFPEKVEFSTEIPIRKIDLSMDLHVSFASILDLVFEAHLQFFEFLGYSVTNIHGKSIIFANLSIDYQGELFYRDMVKIETGIDNMQEKYMDLYFRLQKDQNKPVATVKIRVLFFDYSLRKVVAIPKEFWDKFPHAHSTSPKIEEEKPVSNKILAEKKWKEMKIRKLTQTLVKEIYEFTSELPTQEEDNLFPKMRSLGVSILTFLTQSYHNKIYSERMKSLLRMEASLWELEELFELCEALEYSKVKKPIQILRETLELTEEYRIRSLSVKKIALSKK